MHIYFFDFLSFFSLLDSLSFLDFLDFFSSLSSFTSSLSFSVTSFETCFLEVSSPRSFAAFLSKISLFFCAASSFLFASLRAIDAAIFSWTLFLSSVHTISTIHII
ncbi:hypothetical protein M501DRAFT_533895 [Patellaria atrata CBS 101060]|uniref:Uncharacterized protein n=1 Tax=Patellaria atrata CBS 101060 TaxID=1346257 RepID=A0A9P4SEE1_9PEZI|nr:hypothetical protein M501DRAFT_533895 [Patellaria atrata CBS 101060]